jgi:hypothetical protein
MSGSPRRLLRMVRIHDTLSFQGLPQLDESDPPFIRNGPQLPRLQGFGDSSSSDEEDNDDMEIRSVEDLVRQLRADTYSARGAIARVARDGRPQGKKRRRPRPPPARVEELLGASVECTICMESVEAGTIVRKLPCSHRFHDSCLDQWICRDTGFAGPTCPNCRARLDGEEGDEVE